MTPRAVVRLTDRGWSPPGRGSRGGVSDPPPIVPDPDLPDPVVPDPDLPDPVVPDPDIPEPPHPVDPPVPPVVDG